MAMNICFYYLYRDAGNFKQFGEVVFANPNRLSVVDLTEALRAVLDEGLYFVADEVGVPDLRTNEWDEELDHIWHEVDLLVLTADAVTDRQGRSIEVFLKAFGVVLGKG